MCVMDGYLAGEYGTPCGSCPEYLNTCMPVVTDGYIYGECDFSYCEFCSCYEQCAEVAPAYYYEQKESEGIKYEAGEL